MTAKRDLKRRVRQRQARTGESYVTARRRVLAQRTGTEAGEAISRRKPIAREDTEPGATTERGKWTAGGEAILRRKPIARETTEPDARSERVEATGGETEARRRTNELEATQPGETVEPDDEIESRAKVEPDDEIESRAKTERGEREAAQRRQSGDALRRAARLWRATGQAADIIAAGETEDAEMPVVELHEVTGEARALGFRCRITVYPTVLEACELASLLVGLQEALVRTAGDTGTAHMFAVAFGLPSRPFVRALPEPYQGNTLLKFMVTGRRGAVEIACRLWCPAATLILRLADEIEPDLPATPSAPLHLEPEGPRASGPPLGRLEQELFEQALRLSRLEYARRPRLFMAEGARRPRLFIVDGEHRYLVGSNPFVIGRAVTTSDLAIREGVVSRKHAAVIFRNGTYYIKDLGSTHGIEFKGMRIDNKRIDEGDVFRIGTHDLRFTYREKG